MLREVQLVVPVPVLEALAEAPPKCESMRETHRRETLMARDLRMREELKINLRP